jgi:hypothetical protein
MPAVRVSIRSRPARVARFDAVVLGRSQVGLDLDLRNFLLEVDMEVFDTFNVGKRILDFLGLCFQHVEVLAVDAHDDSLRRAGQHFLDSLAEVGLHVAIKTRIFVSNRLHAFKSLVEVS